MREKEKIAVVGASGYAGEELLERLLNHPWVDIVCLTSRQHAGRALLDVCPRFGRIRRPAGEPGWAGADLDFVAPDAVTIIHSGARVALLALPHGLAAEFAVPLLEAGLRVIDLSADFRLRDPAAYREFYDHEHPAAEWLPKAIYGLPEIPGRRASIAAAKLVAAPGCYPTSILVPLIPLLHAGLIEPGEILVSSMSGVSGAGRKPDLDLLYAECNENARPYGVPKHRHLSEIEQELSLAANAPITISFVPHLVPITRGIVTTIFAKPSAAVDPAAVAATWQSTYGEEEFIRLLPAGTFPQVRDVARTNFIDLAWRHDSRAGRWLLFSAEDNVVKGAAGQAIQCLNLMIGAPESTAL